MFMRFISAVFLCTLTSKAQGAALPLDSTLEQIVVYATASSVDDLMDRMRVSQALDWHLNHVEARPPQLPDGLEAYLTSLLTDEMGRDLAIPLIVRLPTSRFLQLEAMDAYFLELFSQAPAGLAAVSGRATTAGSWRAVERNFPRIAEMLEPLRDPVFLRTSLPGFRAEFAAQSRLAESREEDEIRAALSIDGIQGKLKWAVAKATEAALTVRYLAIRLGNERLIGRQLREVRPRLRKVIAETGLSDAQSLATLIWAVQIEDQIPTGDFAVHERYVRILSMSPKDWAAEGGPPETRALFQVLRMTIKLNYFSYLGSAKKRQVVRDYLTVVDRAWAQAPPEGSVALMRELVAAARARSANDCSGFFKAGE